MRILVTGHRGYIGSVMVNMLKEQGHFVIGVDNNYTHMPVDLVTDKYMSNSVGDLPVAQAVVENDIDYIFHFAASASVGDSVTNPALYYWNNLGETAKFLGNLHKRGWTGKFIFSSTAAVYGDRYHHPIMEGYATQPCNSYGHSKLMCEQAIRDICTTAGIDAVMFRYFNVAGAYGNAGDHLDSDHIIPKICDAVANKRIFTINGSDYNTRDGTCIRDYVHVVDICRAHLHAAEWLSTIPEAGIHAFNLGSSQGFSNKEIVENFVVPVDYTYGPRREGDPAKLVADNQKFIKWTGFEYTHTNLKEILTSSWEWYNKCKTRNLK